MRKPTHYGPLFVLIDVEEETREWVARPDYHYIKEVRGRMIFDVGYSLDHKNTGSKTPNRDDAAHRPTGERDIKYKDKQPNRLWGWELLARRTGGSMLATTMPPTRAATPTEKDVINTSSDSDNDAKLNNGDGDRAGTKLGPDRVDKGKQAVRPQSAGVPGTQDPQSTEVIHGSDVPDISAQALLHATYPDGWRRLFTSSGQDSRCGTNAIVNSFAANMETTQGPPKADQIIAIMSSARFIDREVAFTDWNAHDDESQQVEADGHGFRIDRLGLALSLWALQARNLHVRLGVVVQDGPTLLLSYSDGESHADGITIWIHNDNARARSGLSFIDNHYEGITGRTASSLGPNATNQDLLTAARQEDGSEDDGWDGWEDESTHFTINLNKVRRKSV